MEQAQLERHKAMKEHRANMDHLNEKMCEVIRERDDLKIQITELLNGFRV